MRERRDKVIRASLFGFGGGLLLPPYLYDFDCRDDLGATELENGLIMPKRKVLKYCTILNDAGSPSVLSSGTRSRTLVLFSEVMSQKPHKSCREAGDRYEIVNSL